jgi:hypothetical protein
MWEQQLEIWMEDVKRNSENLAKMNEDWVISLGIKSWGAFQIISMFLRKLRFINSNKSSTLNFLNSLWKLNRYLRNDNRIAEYLSSQIQLNFSQWINTIFLVCKIISGVNIQIDCSLRDRSLRAMGGGAEEKRQTAQRPRRRTRRSRRQIRRRRTHVRRFGWETTLTKQTVTQRTNGPAAGSVRFLCKILICQWDWQSTSLETEEKNGCSLKQEGM